jgi:GntR family transcriptional regulator, transcriptional repressor for pyruvate dehydrogenase complex
MDAETKALKKNAAGKFKLHEQIVGRIQALIRTGRLKGGNQLPPERELAAMFQVSRHAVREAIRILEEKKILRSRTGSGTYLIVEDESSVVDLLARAIRQEKENLSEIFQFRRMIEPQIAAMAAENATPEDIRELEKIYQAHRLSAENVPACIRFDEVFHRAVAKATRNSIVLHMVERINDILAKSRGELSQSAARRRQSLAGHRKILAALRRGDAPAAYQAMYEHLTRIESIVIHQTPSTAAAPVRAARKAPAVKTAKAEL